MTPKTLQPAGEPLRDLSVLSEAEEEDFSPEEQERMRQLAEAEMDQAEREIAEEQEEHRVLEDDLYEAMQANPDITRQFLEAALGADLTKPTVQ